MLHASIATIWPLFRGPVYVASRVSSGMYCCGLTSHRACSKFLLCCSFSGVRSLKCPGLRGARLQSQQSPCWCGNGFNELSLVLPIALCCRLLAAVVEMLPKVDCSFESSLLLFRFFAGTSNLEGWMLRSLRSRTQSRRARIKGLI